MDEYDLVVVGGGPAGVGTALSAAELELKTAIIEKTNMLGGNWTNGYVISILGVYTYSGKTKIVGGTVDKIIAELVRNGGSRGKVGNFIPFRPDEMKLTLEEMISKLNIDIYFSSLVTSADLDEGKIKSITISGKKGKEVVKGKVFVDSSGDADLAFIATNATMSGKEENGEHQQATIPFRIANVNEEGIAAYSKTHPEEISLVMDEKGGVSRIRITSLLVEKAKDDGSLYLPFGNSLFLFNTSKKGEYVCNATHSNVVDYTEGKQLALSIDDARRQIKSVMDFLVKKVPGFENAYLLDSAPSIGMRETRRAVGEYVLRKEDVIGNAKFDDKIVRCGHPIEIHDQQKGTYYQYLGGGNDSWYEIPYRAIVVKGVRNLFAIGRCLSAEFEAQASARVTGTSIGMGQAAATAAYIMIKKGISAAKDIDIKELQKALVEKGAIL